MRLYLNNSDIGYADFEDYYVPKCEICLEKETGHVCEKCGEVKLEETIL
jgi:predicted adenine nucleotide alpha hydrolase (AANH) superfamily ATPase